MLMEQYYHLLQHILYTGSKVSNRTGIDTIRTPGAMLRFDLNQGFPAPALTTKKLYFDVMKAELIGFLRGYTSAAEFRALGCNIWDANANETPSWLANPNRKGVDDLGNIYGAIWRRWQGEDGRVHDQLNDAVFKILRNPQDRRIIINGWNVDQLDKMALPPCHVLYQFLVDTREDTLHLCMYQRSCDMFLGVPFNIASASTLLTLVAGLTGKKLGTFTHFLADAHIYENHREQVVELLKRPHYAPPTLSVNVPNLSELPHFDNLADSDLRQRINFAIADICPSDISLNNYTSHPPLKAPMAI